MYYIIVNFIIVFNVENVFIRLFFYIFYFIVLVYRLVFGGSNWVDVNIVKFFIDGNEVILIIVIGIFNLEVIFDLFFLGIYFLEL